MIQRIKPPPKRKSLRLDSQRLTAGGNYAYLAKYLVGAKIGIIS